MRSGINGVFMVLLLMLGALLNAAACGDQPSGEATFEKGATPDEVFEDFVTQESDSGLIRWRLTAPLANRFNAKNLVLMNDPKIEFYDRTGKLETTLTSEKGEYYEDTRDMLSYGNVVVVSNEGDVLETDSLLWVNQRGKIISHCFVTLKRGRNIITGVGLECDQDLSSVDIKKHVEAKILDEQGNKKDE
jgi:LPS export ABC transporter protein LptC